MLPPDTASHLSVDISYSLKFRDLDKISIPVLTMNSVKAKEKIAAPTSSPPHTYTQ